MQVVFDFSKLLQPHGEDSYYFEKKQRNLTLTVGYDDNSKFVKVVFHNCSYFYIAPVPGYFPQEILSTDQGHSTLPGCVIEFKDSEFVKKSTHVALQAGHTYERRHFFVYLSSCEVMINLLATECKPLVE